MLASATRDADVVLNLAPAFKSFRTHGAWLASLYTFDFACVGPSVFSPLNELRKFSLMNAGDPPLMMKSLY